MNDYDYVVAGAGSAGAVIASRLSEDPALRVLLVEAGPDYAAPGTVPADLLDGSRMSLSEHDWGYRADIHGGRKIRFPRGRVTGGSSAVGAVVALRGVPADYDEWAAAGNPLWDYEQVLPYFRRLEDDLDFADEWHGRGGPIPIRRWPSDELSASQLAFVDACVAAGYPEVADHNRPGATGIGPIPSNRRVPGVRFSTAMGYLDPARGRENLTVVSGSLVDKVVLENGRAAGLELVSSGGTSTVRARRVVLCAGAVNSPAILLRSGIGPRRDLAELGVPLAAELDGVGANLIDHPRTGAFMSAKPGSWQETDAFLQTILRTTSTSEAVDGAGPEFNDLQYYQLGHFDLTLFPELRMLASAQTILGVMVVHQRPQSRGRLRLTSADPAAHPEIELNFLDHAWDRRVLTEGVRRSWQLLTESKVAEFGDRSIVLDAENIADDEMVALYVQMSLDSAYHPVGTAKMGPDPEHGAVVDQTCAVHGVPGLYVADASVLPSIVRCNTNPTTIMIGERVAEWLRGS
ncbi:GMC family oxidoreductase [Amycolatopsis sp. NPDC059235]|uniref:GMC family oxidoreductase n=1 Tax=Amycolatopsis sp. NPDC059235 TaxID=3346782 RepID=UPI003670EF2B